MIRLVVGFRGRLLACVVLRCVLSDGRMDG